MAYKLAIPRAGDSRPSFVCPSCEYVKTTCKVIKKERTVGIADAFGAEIHTDLWGPSTVQTIGGCKYYVTFTDDHTRYTKIDLLKTKDQALQAYKGFANWAQMQHGVRIKRLRLDRGGEYTGNEFTKFLQSQGTKCHLTTHDMPQHNGIAKSLNRHILERVRAMLHHAGLPKNLWGKATLFAVWLKNCTSTKVLGKVTPFEQLNKYKPNFKDVPEWGQHVWVHMPGNSKLEARGMEARGMEAHWVGYDEDSTHAHRIYWPNKHRVSVECDIKFAPLASTVQVPPVSPQIDSAPLPTAIQTSTQPKLQLALTISMPPTPISMPISGQTLVESTPEKEDPINEGKGEGLAHEATVQSQPPTPQPTAVAPQTRRQSSTQATRASARISKPSQYVKQLVKGEGSMDGKGKKAMPGFQGWHLDSSSICTDNAVPQDFIFSAIPVDDIIFAAIQDAQGDPKTLHEAQSRSDWPEWQQAMDREIAMLQQAGTWTDVEWPADKNVVGSKWVFRLKFKADGTVDKYKARLVVHGFTQQYGMDYYDTYSPVAKLASFRTILALAAWYDWDVQSFDFNGAYLNGELEQDDEIYMQPPPGYDITGEGKVLRLLKLLYGLKQAGRRWYETLTRALADLGFCTSQADPAVFHARVAEETLILAIHVDDCALTGSSSALITQYKERLNARFPLTDLGPIHWLLGIKITCNRSNRTVSLSQRL
jgi:Reverse transcriptase (RNA-dependent DNA polymerase)